jgi:Nucleoporin complex subunit 54
MDLDIPRGATEPGIRGLQKWAEEHIKEDESCRKRVADLRGHLESLEKSTRVTAVKVEELRAKQLLLFNRMLSVVRSVEVLRSRGVPVNASERRYRKHLEQLMGAMQVPHSKLQELMVLQVSLPILSIAAYYIQKPCR